MTAPTLATTGLTAQLYGGSGQPNKGIGRSRQILPLTFDFASFNTAGSTSGSAEKLMVIPANSELIIHAAWINTAITGATLFSLGDSAALAQWVSASTGSSVGFYAALANTSKAYAVADYLCVTPTFTQTPAGQLTVVVELVDLTPDAIAVVP